MCVVTPKVPTVPENPRKLVQRTRAQRIEQIILFYVILFNNRKEEDNIY